MNWRGLFHHFLVRHHPDVSLDGGFARKRSVRPRRESERRRAHGQGQQQPWKHSHGKTSMWLDPDASQLSSILGPFLVWSHAYVAEQK